MSGCVVRVMAPFPWTVGSARSKVLSLVQALRLTWCRLRRNATYQDLHDDVGIGMTTAWDYHQTMVAVLADTFGCDDSVATTRTVSLSA